MKELFCTPEFWIMVWASNDPQWDGLKKEMKFDFRYGPWQSPQELAQWYAELFQSSRVFEPSTDIGDFIGIEKEVKAVLMERRS